MKAEARGGFTRCQTFSKHELSRLRADESRVRDEHPRACFYSCRVPLKCD